MRAIFQKKGKKGQNVWKFRQKCTKFENISKKGSLMRATVARMKQLDIPWLDTLIQKIWAFHQFLKSLVLIIKICDKHCVMLKTAEISKSIGTKWVE